MWIHFCGSMRVDWRVSLIPLSLIRTDGHVALVWPLLLPPFPTCQTAPLFHYPELKFHVRWQEKDLFTNLTHGLDTQAAPVSRRMGGNVIASIFMRLNWNIFTNVSQLALYWINTACFPPFEQIVSCEHKFAASVPLRDGEPIMVFVNTESTQHCEQSHP